MILDIYDPSLCEGGLGFPASGAAKLLLPEGIFLDAAYPTGHTACWKQIVT